MLEQLIESKSDAKQTVNRLEYLLTTFVLVAGLCFSAVLWSLFTMNLSVGAEEFDLSALVAPVMPVENKPEPEQNKQEKQAEEIVTETTRQSIMLRPDESPTEIPAAISVTPNKQKARPTGAFKITNGPERDVSTPRGTFNDNSEGGNNLGQGIKPNMPGNDNESDLPELKKPEKKTPPIKNLGVVNSQATYLPKPIYPKTAQVVGAGGAVNVQIMIDETGKVISAKAVSGHPLLQGAAVSAARNARFTPTYLSQQPIKVTGLIIYNFTRN